MQVVFKRPAKKVVKLTFDDLSVGEDFIIDSPKSRGTVYRKVKLSSRLYSEYSEGQMEILTSKVFAPTTSNVKRVQCIKYNGDEMIRQGVSSPDSQAVVYQRLRKKLITDLSVEDSFALAAQAVTNLEIELVEFKSWPQNLDKSSNVDNDERKPNQLVNDSLSISNRMTKTSID